jgi:hypothetical protein
MTFCIGMAIAHLARDVWAISRRDLVQARHCEGLTHMWVAAAVIIWSLK